LPEKKNFRRREKIFREILWKMRKGGGVGDKKYPVNLKISGIFF